MLRELLYADDLVLISETIEGLWNEFIKWKEAVDSKGLKVNPGKTKVMVSGGITKDDLHKSTFDPCEDCSLRAKSNSVLCIQCNKLIYHRCTGVERVTVNTFIVADVKRLMEMQWSMEKRNVIVSGGITKDDLHKSKFDPCEDCSLRANSNSVLCIQCNK